MTGYMNMGYAESLAEFGVPRELPESRGWILERTIQGFPYRDGMGCYPLFACRDWSRLHRDLEGLGDDLVSLTLVTDPFGEYEIAQLQQCFHDLVFPFKEHFVVDLSRPAQESVSARRRKHARRAFKKVEVEVCHEPARFLDEWVALYDKLIEKHEVRGIRAFSRSAFARQLSIPGTVMLRALHENVAVAAQLYYLQEEVVHCHLGASSDAGYALGAIYALDYFSIEYFADKARWLNLGGGAGTSNDGKDGLSDYKRGWATDSRTVYLCGRILNRERYTEIVEAKGAASTTYFPAYRKGEFD